MATAPAPAQAADPRAGVTPRRLVLLGGGEHARVVAEAAKATPGAWLVGAVDADAEAALAAELAATAPDDRPSLVLGFGGPPDARRRAASASGLASADWATIVHPAAWVSPSARLGPGAVVLAGAIVNANAVVGRHVIVNTRAVVEHDVRLGDFVHVAPGATIGGGTAIGDDAHVGLGASVRDHVTIGAGAVVGMGAVVVADVPDRAVVVGVPARATTAGQ